MASKVHLGLRRDAARQSIEDSIKELAAKSGIEVPVVVEERAPDADHKHMLELERIATQLSLVVHNLPTNEPAPAPELTKSPVVEQRSTSRNVRPSTTK